MKIIKKNAFLLIKVFILFSCFFAFAEKSKQNTIDFSLTKDDTYSVQIVNYENVNLSKDELSWLPFQVQDKLNSNLQAYLKMKTVVDLKSEITLKKIQAESELEGRDISSSIEFGKITTAKYAIFVKIRKTNIGYTISIDFINLTTGEKIASCLSKEYSKAEFLYEKAGAVDEITMNLAKKLGISFDENGLYDDYGKLSLDEQMFLSKQSEMQYKRLIENYEIKLSQLITSNDMNLIGEINKIETQKELLQKKYNEEKKIQKELAEKKIKAKELKFKVSLGVLGEGNMYSIKGIAPSVGILFDYAFSKKFSLGVKTNFSYDVFSKNNQIFTVEPLAFSKLYLIPVAENPCTGIFLEAQIGTSLLKIDSELITSISVAGGIGYRFGLNNFYFEPILRMGYPFIIGLGCSAGIRL